jgi:hypothetical protein
MEGMSREIFNNRYHYRYDPNGEKHCINCDHSGWYSGDKFICVGPEQCSLMVQCGAINPDINLNDGLCDLWLLKKTMENCGDNNGTEEQS